MPTATVNYDNSHKPTSIAVDMRQNLGMTLRFRYQGDGEVELHSLTLTDDKNSISSDEIDQGIEYLEGFRFVKSVSRKF